MKISALKCRQCGRELSGLANDVVFACADCHRAYVYSLWGRRDGDRSAIDIDSPVSALTAEFRGAADYPVRFYDGLARVPLQKDMPRLPFWLFRIRPSFSGTDTARVERYKILEQPVHSLIPAFAFHGLQYIGWPGQELNPATPPPLHEEDTRLRGVILDPFTAFILCWYRIYQQADRLADISNVSMTLEHLETTLVGVHFDADANRVHFPFSDRDYPVVYFDDLAAIMGR